jgi:Zn-dependent metalloprotease
LLCRATGVALTALIAITGTVQAAQYERDPFARREAAKATAARDPVGELHLQHAMAMRDALGLSPDDTFVVLNAATDEEGNTHVRLRQLHQGVPVRGGELLSHTDARGTFLTYDGQVQKDIRIDTRPRVPAEAASAIAARQPSHKFDYSWAPRVELSIQTNYVRVDAHRGKPLEESSEDIDHTDPAALSDLINAADTMRQVSGHTLVWTVRTVEGREGFDEEINEVIYTIDAQTGDVLHERSAGWNATDTGSGNFNKNVSFSTLSLAGIGFLTWDITRNFQTMDNDFVWFTGSNADANNVWGDGQPYMGDLTATLANRQSAMVEGHFGETVYWDMMANVFNRKGFDGNKIGLTVFAHVGTGIPGLIWDDANYSSSTGNIRLGDGSSRQSLDCLGHESGHGFADHTADLGGNMGDAINESQADIWGAMTNFYLGGSGFATQSSTIPASSGSLKNPFTLRCSNRNMMKPTLGSGKDKSDFWNVNLDNWPDEHDRGQPNNRAFFFLAQGASPFMKDNNYSHLLPWGMTGIGNDKAARLWFFAMRDHMVSDPDYNDVKAALSLALIMHPNTFNLVSTTNALLNAYAGINVSSVMAGYPAEPALQVVNGGTTPQTALSLALPNTALGASKPGKVKFFSTGGQTLYYRISLPPGASATVRINSVSGLDDWDLEIIDELSWSVVVSSTKGKGKFDLGTVTAGSGLGNQGESYLIKIKPYSLQANTGAFVMDIDRF